ncbi:hypothetical protein SUDANB145_04834 [Streptomyces sp. enrichment culture]|uniref:hypothetical protein n=1 Tax=Streptomyces sp. enrichment culture TaxID=1795815 RepID=UPI003F574C61
MNDELTLLAQSGAAALVAAMATDVWQETRNTVVGLFRRSGDGRGAAVEHRLDDDAALLRDAGAPDDVRRILSGYWSLELAALLRRDPSCGPLLAPLAAAAGPGASVLRQTNTARDGAAVFAVQQGTQHAHWAPRTGDRPPETDDTSG